MVKLRLILPDIISLHRKGYLLSLVCVAANSHLGYLMRAELVYFVVELRV